MNPQNIENKNFNFKNPEKLLDEKENLKIFESAKILRLSKFFENLPEWEELEKICSKVNGGLEEELKKYWLDFYAALKFKVKNPIWNTEIA